MATVQQVQEIARPIVESRGAYIVEVTIGGRENGMVLELFIDTDSGVTTDQCAEISMELSRALDMVNVFQRRYHLVVSSPGLGRPLKFPRQYPRNIGRQFSITYRNGEKVTKVQGTLLEVTNEGIRIETDQEPILLIPFGAIVEARVKTPW